MNSYRIRGRLAAMVALQAGVVLVCACRPEAPPVVTPAPPPLKLVVITPHSPTIRQLFATGFSDWYHKRFNQFVDIQWIPMGTLECLQYIEQVADEHTETAGRAIPDVMFGGGIMEHRVLIERRRAKAVDIKDAYAGIPDTVLGLPTRHPEGYWHATALSEFGILYNKKACLQRGIPEPATWTDLARPDFQGWVALADPVRSGSHLQCLTLILQRYGWKDGWATVLRIAANSRALLPSSQDAINDVRTGVALAALSVSFTALQEIEAAGPNELAYVSPQGASAVTPSLVTVLSGAAIPSLAEQFVRFCLSEEAQVLWGVKAEARQGFGDTLYHYPILPKIYEAYAGKLAVTENPFTKQPDMTLDLDLAARQAQIVAPLLRDACRENHVLLQQCWKRLVEAGLPEAPLAELTAPPFADERAAYEAGARYAAGGAAADALSAEWAGLFRARYEKVLSTLK